MKQPIPSPVSLLAVCVAERIMNIGPEDAQALIDKLPPCGTCADVLRVQATRMLAAIRGKFLNAVAMAVEGDYDGVDRLVDEVIKDARAEALQIARFLTAHWPKEALEQAGLISDKGRQVFACPGV